MEKTGTLSLYVILEMPGAVEAKLKLVYTERGIGEDQARDVYDTFQRKNTHVSTVAKFTPDSVWF